ncbi:little elongation complex subunit 1 isoform X3 [Cavia porcellus]|uniref:little elongation complex subunit 1 isoform X3 n=1 Tax=Cavia porcellus TaxID=10141 RepID=UPI002FE31AD9
MMPGETHSAAPGTAADLARCQGCASLQQNLNEYVEALITLKQKIINTDNLLTEYQKKCDELQFARRENSTLHHQVEQMLQKISPLQKCQEELGSLKAELEEKKNSLKLYQDTHQEYARVKEECLKSDAQKKKLEAKVKKLEEAAVRQTQDFKQLRNEKKILEKEFKKTQERLDEFSRQKSEKELRHIGTQISSDSCGSIDKRKVKLLLKELWLCVNSARRLPGDGRRRAPEKPAKEDIRSRVSEEDDMLPLAPGSPPRSSNVQTCLAALSREMQADFAAWKSVAKEQPSGVNHSASRVVSNEDRDLEALPRSPEDWDGTGFAHHGHLLDRDLQAAMDFFRLPPPLLSPVPSPPCMSSPQPGSLPSALTSVSVFSDETYFGECTDSSDSDSTHPGNPADSISEDDITESQDYFGLSRKNKARGAWEEKPRSQEAIQAVNEWTVNTVAAGGLAALTVARSKPPATSPVAREEPLVGPSEMQAESPRAASGEVRRPGGVGESAECLQADRTHHTPSGSLWGERLSCSLTGDKDKATEKSALHRTPQKELGKSKGGSLPFRMAGSCTSEFTEWTRTNEVALEAGRVTGPGCLQRVSGAMTEGTGDMQGSTSEELPEPEPEEDCGGTGGAVGQAGLGVRAGVSSSSPMAPGYVCSTPQAAQLGSIAAVETPAKGIPPKLHRLEQNLQTKTSNTLLRSEPPEHSIQENNLESSLRSLSPELGVRDMNDQKSREIEGTKIIKGLTKMYSFPLSVFRKATKDGLCETQDPGMELTLQRSDWASLAGPQAAVVRSGCGFVKSTSWHHSDFLRSAGESPRVSSAHERESGCQFDMAAPALQNRGSGAMPQRPGESARPVGLTAAAALLPNQVSVITKQTRPPQTPSAHPEHWSPNRKAPHIAAGNQASRRETPAAAEPGGEGEDTVRSTEEVAARRSAAPRPPSAWRHLDPPTDSILAGSSACSGDSEVAFSSGNRRPCSLEVSRGAATQDEAQMPEPSPPFPGEDARGAELAVSGGCPVREVPRGDPEALAGTLNPPSTSQEASGTPGAALPVHFVTPSVTFSSPLCSTAEARHLSQSGPLASAFCCAAIREARDKDSEVEGSESDVEADGLGRGPRDATGNTQKALGSSEAGGPETGASLELGDLTSALQEFNLSPSPDIDRLSASGVLMFFENCQLRDYSSGDSISECSSKGTLNKEVDKELKARDISGERPEEQPCEEEAPGSPGEWVEGEEDCSLRAPSPLAQCSLEMQAEVLSSIGQELEIGRGDFQGNDPGRLLLLKIYNSLTVEDLKDVLPLEVAPHPPEPPLPTATPDVQGSHLAIGRSLPEHTGSGPEDSPQATKPAAPEEGRAAPPTWCAGSAAEAIPQHSPGCEGAVRRAHREGAMVQGQGALDAPFASLESPERAPGTSVPGPASQEPPGSGSPVGAQGAVSSSGQSSNFDKSRLRNRPVKPSIWVSSQIYDQPFEPANITSDHTYYNSKLEPSGKNKIRVKIPGKDLPGKPAKTAAPARGDPPPSGVGDCGSLRTLRGQAQPVVAKADTSTPTDCTLDALSRIRQEVGPPLPPLLAPLVATPPRTTQPVSPLRSLPSPGSPGSPASPAEPPALSPWPEEPSPPPSAAWAAGRSVSSPLQFCAATPKHALPVPGRLPPCAPSVPTATAACPPENSVKILDTMYPELSARARTLSILKGNLQLSRGSSTDGKTLPGPMSALIGLKAITSSSTAFVKAGGDTNQDRPRDSGQDSGAKRTLAASTLRGAKRLRLDSESPEPEVMEAASRHGPKSSLGKPPHPEAEPIEQEGSGATTTSPGSQVPSKPKETVESHNEAIAQALKKIAESSFDLLPVIRSHVHVGNISKKPVMRDQEKEVVYEFSTTKKRLAECLLHSILSELKTQKVSEDHSYMHALCRVYVGVCRQLGDLARARLFCYSLLKEDFPESEKLTLFIANMWHDVFASPSVISKAMQLVARQRARGEVLSCLKAFLSWEKNAPVDVGIMVSKLLLTIQLCPKTEFQPSEKYGEDLSDNTWECIFAIDLLCSHQKWVWTHDNIISKELWPVMDKWIKYRKGHTNVAYTPDVIIASILRLIGRLGQLGLKEGFPTTVKNISSVIGMFIQHAQDEDIPWGIQLAAVYALCDLSPSNPEEILKILEAWRRETSHCVPSAIASCLEEVGALRTGDLR